MSIEIYRKEVQARGQFDGGKIVENKPVGFPREGGSVTAYSNIFYWANAESPDGGFIAEHPHKGFEIMSFVIDGSIEHFDSGSNKWIPLKKGDMQIIRAGNGITHAERLNPGGRMFQIWLDPNLEKTLKKPASYNDHKADEFPVNEKNGYSEKIYKGDAAPLKMDSEGVAIKEYIFENGESEIEIDDNMIYSAYLINGEITVNGKGMRPDDFCIIKDEKKLKVKAESESKFFMIGSPAKLSYKTYSEMF